MENSSIFGNKSNSITGVLLIYHSFLSFISPTAQLLVWLVCRCSAMWWFFLIHLTRGRLFSFILFTFYSFVRLSLYLSYV